MASDARVTAGMLLGAFRSLSAMASTGGAAGGAWSELTQLSRTHPGGDEVDLPDRMPTDQRTLSACAEQLARQAQRSSEFAVELRRWIRDNGGGGQQSGPPGPPMDPDDDWDTPITQQDSHAPADEPGSVTTLEDPHGPSTSPR